MKSFCDYYNRASQQKQELLRQVFQRLLGWRRSTFYSRLSNPITCVPIESAVLGLFIVCDFSEVQLRKMLICPIDFNLFDHWVEAHKNDPILQED